MKPNLDRFTAPDRAEDRDGDREEEIEARDADRYHDDRGEREVRDRECRE